jgi:tRNA(fMet)-specific endonuclease VapC
MNYLLDTDHLSIIQRETGQDYINLINRMSQHLLSDFTVSIITLHEQLLGSHAYINRARTSDEVVKGYEIMARIWKDFTVLPIVLFDQTAASAFNSLRSQRIQLATMDMRIAAIALSCGLILLTRNSQDFGKVPKLTMEDWTMEQNGGAG